MRILPVNTNIFNSQNRAKENNTKMFSIPNYQTNDVLSFKAVKPDPTTNAIETIKRIFALLDATTTGNLPIGQEYKTFKKQVQEIARIVKDDEGFSLFRNRQHIQLNAHPTEIGALNGTRIFAFAKVTSGVPTLRFQQFTPDGKFLKAFDINNVGSGHLSVDIPGNRPLTKRAHFHFDEREDSYGLRVKRYNDINQETVLEQKHSRRFEERLLDNRG